MASYDHEFQLSFGLQSPSYGGKSLWEEEGNGRFGNGTNGDHPKGPTTTTTTRRKARGSQNAYL
ncbi:AVB_G0043250.mRNA.1.CDS.1 [Saccharomyces cerevisiae]|nr:AVB_G0043250.mRNA.1.CDS.1 [Saccharomyces cerevisiae]CAI7253606.1 AVB_G0043250.mRNA.1.CDS.1 [Saccharomyces cerevisiae]